LDKQVEVQAMYQAQSEGKTQFEPSGEFMPEPSVIDHNIQCQAHSNIITNKAGKCSVAYRCSDLGCPRCVAYGEENYLEKVEAYLERKERLELDPKATREQRLAKAIARVRATCVCAFSPKPEPSFCRKCSSVKKLAA